MITTTGWDGTGAPHPNSCRINIAAGDTLQAAMDAIEAFLTTHSWELWDAAAGTNARAYRCQALPDAIGAIHYGYIVLDYNTSGSLFLKLYETWNATTHIGTNLAGSSGIVGSVFPAVAAGVFSSIGWLKIQATHLGIFLIGNNGSITGSTDNGPIFVAQLARTCPEDLVSVGYPKWAWGRSHGMDPNSYQTFYAVPKLRGNSTQVRAVSSFGASYAGNSALPLMPAYLDALTGKILCSNILGIGSMATGTTIIEVFGTFLDVVTLTFGQGVPNVDDVTFLADDDLDFGGAAFVHAHGSMHTWWLIGGTVGRLAVRK